MSHSNNEISQASGTDEELEYTAHSESALKTVETESTPSNVGRKVSSSLSHPTIKLEPEEDTSENLAGVKPFGIPAELQTTLWHRNQINVVAAEEQAPDSGFSSEIKDRDHAHELEPKSGDHEANGALERPLMEIEIDLMRARNEDATRQRLLRSQQEYDQACSGRAYLEGEDSLFIPQSESTAIKDFAYAYVDDIPDCQQTDELSIADADQCEIRGSGSTRGKQKVIKGRVNKSRAKKALATTSSGGGKRRGKVQQSNMPFSMGSLLSHDVAAQAQANENTEAQPGFTNKRKDLALKELIASIPENERDLYNNDRILLQKATTKFSGRGAMKADGNGMWKLRGMKSSLHHYQTIGVSMMRDREAHGAPNGGMLSDSMGMGKTVTQIANMIDGRPTSTCRGKATLVVVPASLTKQWLDEIKKHAEPEFLKNCTIYRSSSDKYQADPVQALSEYDVVITTFHEVSKSMPKKIYPVDLTTERAKQEWWEEYFHMHKGVLHRVYFHRIVLDEAQVIKNHLSRVSEAAWRLRGKYRWASSGTPVQNSLEEFYAYFRFLKMPGTGEMETFRKNYCKKGSTAALQRLQAMLDKIMIRRTLEDKLFGRPILQMPPVKPVKTIEVGLNIVERSVYKIIRTRFIAKVVAIQRQGPGSLSKSYSTIIVLLLRLRQLTAHIYMIQKIIADFLEAEDLERLWELTRTEKDSLIVLDDGSHAMMDHLKDALTNKQMDDIINDPTAVVDPDKLAALRARAEAKRASLPARQLSFEFKKCLQVLQENGQWDNVNKRSCCSSCGSQKSLRVTTCLHLYCMDCVTELQFQAAENDQNYPTCGECFIRFKKHELYTSRAYEEAKKLSETQPVLREGSKRGRSSSVENEDIDWFAITGPILQSSKTRAAIKQVEEWWTEDATVKIVIFTQWRPMIRVFERVFEERNWGHTSFHGGMSWDARRYAIDEFTENPDIKILIAGMQAGGVGLNLVAGSRVIIVDLWWNTCVESQAYCRVFRIGQTRDVEVVRLAARNTIDVEIIKMQDRKTKEIDSAVETKNRGANLSTAELLKLFNMSSTGEEGDETDLPFVMPNDPYEVQDEDADGVEEEVMNEGGRMEIE